MDYGKDLEQLFEELGADKLEQEPPRTVLEPEMLEDEEPINEYEREIVDVTDDDDAPNIKDLSGLPDLIVGIIDIFAANVAEAWTKT